MNPEAMEKANFISKVFAAKLEIIVEKIFGQILLIDVKDLFDLKTDPEEYYSKIEQGMDEDVNLRVNFKR